MNYYLGALKNYVGFSGRARRSEFWFFYLFNLIAIFVLSLVSNLLLGSSLLASLYYLAVLLPTIAVGVRRMHDCNKSGWFLIIPIYSIILTLIPGTNGENRFGDDPKGNSINNTETFN